MQMVFLIGAFMACWATTWSHVAWALQAASSAPLALWQSFAEGDEQLVLKPHPHHYFQPSCTSDEYSQTRKHHET
jgi:hypothetical protein